MIHTIGIWIAALLTLCIFSFLYKDNPFYRFAEHLFVGVSAGYWAMYSWYNVLLPNLGRPLFMEHRLILLIPLTLGILMLLRLFPKIGWLSRWPLAFIVGMTSGYYLVTFLQTNALAQARATIVPLNNINNVILIVGVATGLLYFFFSTQHKGAVGVSARIGRMFLMVAFGASFGYTVMARISLLIGRIYFLLEEWLHVI
ncbi:hypothetical protein CH333_06800 [candidate division WOR-3 bacterium JGI_Cruoil_03_44_89]|uniref:Uncharacterized protein n=1 Tax=candidate division WOR-3 bacterium JGI_Cruoil_03_44_89 TaxID=1973748 RepID=A0A235BRX8_UNCW3|nr:MAG: hypothetical protein CH333_07530 [candidate division WOR-3 bacterium JGI_Cruoil_03_44_89]OYD14971.1 MAG: hypothetical protein CH333_06800 [candidate division WOR-3 bacterium JGI_Cruoil_03_44_89]